MRDGGREGGKKDVGKGGRERERGTYKGKGKRGGEDKGEELRKRGEGGWEAIGWRGREEHRKRRT